MKTKTFGNTLKLIIFIIIINIPLFGGCSKKDSDSNSGSTTPEEPFVMRGVDISFLPEIETYGIKFYDNNTEMDLIKLIKAKGINTVRIRLWHAPSDGHCGLTEVTGLAARVKAEGLKVWLDFHYADSWADPQKQPIPDAWKNLSMDLLSDSVYSYTQRVLNHLIHAGAAPDFIQTGNEVNAGFMWPAGKIENFSDPNQTNFTRLMKAATKATRATLPSAKIILHYAGYDGAEQFFALAKKEGFTWDIQGLSYYPWWHGMSLNLLEGTMKSLNSTNKKPTIIAEASYPFSFGWNDATHNLVGEASQLMNGYDATPEGQANYLARLLDLCNSVGGSVRGVCYWAPEWVAFKGPNASDGSTWENQALFDFQNRALPGLDSLGGAK
jgi:arabinogalactan endo-1,4-beta-galactosidase